MCGTINLNHCVARVQSDSNKDFRKEIYLLVHGRKVFKEKITRDVGGFHLLPPELQRTALLGVKCNRESHRYDFKIAMIE